MSTASRAPDERCQVDVYELAPVRGRDAAHQAPCGPIHPTQAVAPVAHQAPVHRRGGDAADARGTQLALAAQLQELAFAM